MGRTWRWALVGPPALACLVYLLVPQKSVAQVLLYLAIVVWSLVATAVGVRRHRPPRARGWWALVGGLSCWAVGELCWHWLVRVAHEEPFPSVADAFYLLGYLFVGLGLVALVRARQPGRDGGALLDAAVVTVGVGVLALVFVVLPLAADSSQTVLGRVVGAAYPLADVLLLGMLVRLVSTAGAATAAYRLLVAAMGCVLVADCAYVAVTLTSDGSSIPRWVDALWLACLVLLSAAALHPTMRLLSAPAPVRQEALSGRRLLALAVAAWLAPITALLQVALGRPPAVLVTASGSLLLFALVLVRMAGLLHRVRSQAGQLAALAAVDALTGVPNRRTWDLELSRACAAATETGEPLAVALLDLDDFKVFNDRFGHQEGDRLLQAAAAAWTAALRPGCLLARYGGEEFALLLPHCDAPDAAAVLDRLRALTPPGATVSGGVTVWDGVEDPGAAVARADAALYAAKRGGRDRVHTCSGPVLAEEPARAH